MNRMQKLGDLLRETREKKGIDIPNASSATKIRESMIIALENGDYKSFNSDNHIKSFIKAYAKYLNINQEKAVAMYRREREIVDEDIISQKTNIGFSFVDKVNYIFKWKILASLIGIFLISIIIYFFYIQIQAVYREPRLELISPSQNQIIESDVFLIEGITDSISVKVVVDGTEANYIDSKGRFKVNAKFSQPGTKTFTITATNEYRKETTINLDLIYRPKETTTITKHRLSIKNNDNFSQKIKYQTDLNQTFSEIEIKSNESFSINFDSLIKIQNFNPNKNEAFLDQATSALKGITASSFEVSIEDSIPILKTTQ